MPNCRFVLLYVNHLCFFCFSVNRIGDQGGMALSSVLHDTQISSLNMRCNKLDKSENLLEETIRNSNIKSDILLPQRKSCTKKKEKHEYNKKKKMQS